MGRRRVAPVGVALLLPLLGTACGISEHLATSSATDCLTGKGLVIDKGTLSVPKDLKNGPLTRKITRLDVEAGPKDHFAFSNHVVVFVAGEDSDIGSVIWSGQPGAPPWVPTGPFVAGYQAYVAVWDAKPTPEQEKLVDGCLFG